MPAHTDLSGSEFNGVKILRVSHKNKRSEYYYECLCHCGKTFVGNGYQVRTGDKKSCGCLLDSRKHGKVNTPEYGVWAAMKRRCFNLNDAHYSNYGGRGITVCERWLDFKNFSADMGERPSPDHQIERKNNNGNYDPSNCKWATHKEQSLNRRSNVILAHGCESMPVTEWARRLNTKMTTLDRRLKRGWSIEKTVTTPVRPMRPKRKSRSGNDFSPGEGGAIA